MIRRTCSFLVCAVGVLLPWRLRIIYAEIIAWTVQCFYYLFFSLLRMMLRNLEHKEGRS
jgi:uncharacterized membrane protein